MSTVKQKLRMLRESLPKPYLLEPLAMSQLVLQCIKREMSLCTPCLNNLMINLHHREMIKFSKKNQLKDLDALLSISKYVLRLRDTQTNSISMSFEQKYDSIRTILLSGPHLVEMVFESRFTELDSFRYNEPVPCVSFSKFNQLLDICRLDLRIHPFSAVESSTGAKKRLYADLHELPQEFVMRKSAKLNGI